MMIQTASRLQNHEQVDVFSWAQVAGALLATRMSRLDSSWTLRVDAETGFFGMPCLVKRPYRELNLATTRALPQSGFSGETRTSSTHSPGFTPVTPGPRTFNKEPAKRSTSSPR